MAAIRISELPCIVVILGKEEGRIEILVGVFIEEPIDRLQEALRLSQREGRIRAVPVRSAHVVHVCLQVGHQESSGDSLA